MEKNYNKRQNDEHLDLLSLKIDETNKELCKIKSSITLIDQSISNNIVPLLHKHDGALYSEDGTNGICRDVSLVKQKLENQAVQLKFVWGFVSTFLLMIAASYFTIQ